MEQPPRIRDAIKDAAKGAWRDATGVWREKAQIGDHVVLDCTLFGVSVWRRAEDGTIERLDPEDVAFSAREPEWVEVEPGKPVYQSDEIPAGGSFPAYNIWRDKYQERKAQEAPPYRELTDSEQAAEEATWD